MNYKHSHVVNTDGYKTAFVLVHILDDGTEQIQFYTLKDGERLVDTPPPGDLVKPRWNGIMWRESATKEEIAAALPTLDDLKAAKKQEIAAARYTDATGYLKIGDHTYNIDAESKTAMNGALIAFQVGALTETDWKTKEGFAHLTAAEFMTVATTVLAYVNQCFAREKELQDAIDAAKTAGELAAIEWGGVNG